MINSNNRALTTYDEDIHTTLSLFSHEIRNPLSLVNCELQLMACDIPEVTHYKRWNEIQEQMQYITDLLNELSSYNNAHKLSLSDVDISDFINTILTSAEPSLYYLGIQLKKELNMSLPACKVDTIKFRQVFLNLLRNAREAVSPGKGIITVRTFLNISGKISISIEDNGCGISPEQLKTIFTPFVTYKKSGTGLGLPISRQIVEAHGGTILVESQPNHGSVFTVFLG